MKSQFENHFRLNAEFSNCVLVNCYDDYDDDYKVIMGGNDNMQEIHDDLSEKLPKALNSDLDDFLKEITPNEKDEEVLQFTADILDDEVIDTKSSIDSKGNVQTCYIKTKTVEKKKEIEKEIEKINWEFRRRRRSAILQDQVCEKTETPFDPQVAALETLNGANSPTDGYGAEIMTQIDMGNHRQEREKEILIMENIRVSNYWDLVDNTTFILTHPETYERYTSVQDEIESKFKKNSEKFNLKRLSSQLNTIRPTLQYAYFKSLTITLRENAGLVGGLKEFLSADGFGLENMSLEEQTKKFYTIKGQQRDRIKGHTKTTDLISEIQINFEAFLVDIRKFMIKLLGASYQIFDLNHFNLKKQLRYKNKSHKLQLFARKGLIRMQEESKKIVESTLVDVDGVLESLDQALLQKTENALKVVKSETKTNVEESQVYADVQKNLRDKMTVFKQKIKMQQNDVDEVNNEIREVHAEWNAFQELRERKKREMKAEQKEVRELIANEKAAFVAEWHSIQDRIEEYQQLMHNEFQVQKKFHTKGYTCSGPQWFLDLCVKARENENLSVKEQWVKLKETMHETNNDLRNKKLDLQKTIKEDVTRLNGKIVKLEKDFHEWRVEERNKAKQKFFQKKQELKVKQLKVLNLRKSMINAEMELDIMNADGDFKTQNLDDTTAALSFVQNSIMIVHQELGNLRAFLEDFPERLKGSNLELRTAANHYNDIVDMQNAGLDIDIELEFLQTNLSFDLENMYSRMISWVLLARQSFATFDIIGKLDTSSMSIDLDELQEIYLRIKKVGVRTLDNEISMLTKDLMLDNMIVEKLPQQFDFDVNEVETGMSMLCEQNETGLDAVCS